MLVINNFQLNTLYNKRFVNTSKPQVNINNNLSNHTKLPHLPVSYGSVLLNRNGINKANGLYNISFTGNGGNPNQILLMSVECKPFAKAGGMGDVNFDMPKAYNKMHKKDGKEIRLMLPVYNSKENLAPIKGHPDKFVLINADIKPDNADRELIHQLAEEGIINDKESLKKFLLKADSELTEDSLQSRLNDLNKKFVVVEKVNSNGIEFQHGLKKGTANLYKLDSKDAPNGTTTYFVEAPDVSDAQKEYAFDSYEKMYSGHASFSYAALALLKTLKNQNGENFNPQKIQTTDWHTAFAVHQLKDMAQKDDFYENKKVAHTVHNIGPAYQGSTNPVSALVNTFTPEEIYTLENDLDTLLACREKFTDEKLKDISDNYDSYMSDPSTRGKIEILSTRIRELFPDKPWDKYGNYNPTLQAIEECDRFLTVSNGFYTDMQVSSEISGVVRPYLYKNKDKGIGIVNGLDVSDYTIASGTKSDIKFKVDNGIDVKKLENVGKVLEQKAKNKEFIQDMLAKDNSKRPKNAVGYLDKNPNAMLGTIISRFDTNQKGIDILINGLEKILNENPDAQIVFGGGGYDKVSSERDKALVQKLKNIIKDNPGRVVLVEGYVDSVAQFMAGGDVFFMPSTYEPCGLMQFQAMAGGCLPVVSKTGGLDETVSSPEEVGDNATGFKTKMSLMDIFAPENEFARVFGQAYNMYKDSQSADGNINENSTWAKMVNNALNNNSTWEDSVGRYEKEIYSKLDLSPEETIKYAKEDKVLSKQERLEQIQREIDNLDVMDLNYMTKLKSLMEEEFALES